MDYGNGERRAALGPRVGKKAATIDTQTHTHTHNRRTNPPSRNQGRDVSTDRFRIRPLEGLIRKMNSRLAIRDHFPLFFIAFFAKIRSWQRCTLHLRCHAFSVVFPHISGMEFFSSTVMKRFEIIIFLLESI